MGTEAILLPAHASNYNTETITYPYYAFVEDPNNPWETVYDALDETGTIEYSDEFFFEPSPGDHPELRALSYALALAGYENQSDGYPADPANPNPKLVNMLDQMGFSDYEMWDTESETGGHSFGTTIGHKTLENGQELIVVAPRNYNYMTEWLSNFNVGNSGDHAGFSESATFVKERFDYYLSERDFSNYKVWMVGYSRGGAVIDLAAKMVPPSVPSVGVAGPQRRCCWRNTSVLCVGAAMYMPKRCTRACVGAFRRCTGPRRCLPSVLLALSVGAST